MRKYKKIKKLTESTIDDVWLAQFPTIPGQIILKRFNLSPGYMDRFEREVYLLRKLSVYSLAPKVIESNLATSTVAIEYIKHKKLNSFKEFNDALPQILTSLRQLHSIKINAPTIISTSSLLSGRKRKAVVMNARSFFKKYEYCTVNLKLLQTKISFIANNVCTAPIENERNSLLHGDLHRSNILVQGRNTYFIDLGMGRLGDVAYDLAYLLIHTFIIQFNQLLDIADCEMIMHRLIEEYEPNVKIHKNMFGRIRVYFIVILSMQLDEFVKTSNLSTSTEKLITYLERLILDY